MTAAYRKTLHWRRRKLIINKQIVLDALTKEGPRIMRPHFIGLMSMKLPECIGKDFLYFDNPYFLRENTKKAMCRIVRGNFHLTTLLRRPNDRWKALEIELRPWRKKGRSIIVVPPSTHYVRLLGCRDWLTNTLEAIKTDRPVIVKATKAEPFVEFIQRNNAFAVVTYGSVAGIEALIEGYPVFSGPLCPTLPISAGPLDCIDRPEYGDREALMSSLAYANWHAHELSKVNLEDYHYDARCDDVYEARVGGLRLPLAGGQEELAAGN